jgi:hypothetical protein
MTFTTHLYLAPKLKKDYGYTCTPALGLHCLFYGEPYFSVAIIYNGEMFVNTVMNFWIP